MSSILKYVQFALYIFFMAGVSQSSFGVPISFSGQPIKLENNVRIFEDVSNQMSPRAVLSNLDNFFVPKGGDLAKGYTGSAVWVLFEMKNKSQSPAVLSSIYPVVQLKTYRVAGTDSHSLAEQKIFGSRRSASYLTFPADRTETFLVKMTSSQFLNLQLIVKDAAEVIEEDNSENMLLSMLMGVLLTAFATNFLMFLLLRQRGHFYYLLFSFVNCHLAFLAIKFPSSILEWGGLNWDFLVHPYSTVGAFTTFLFVRHFLGTRTEFPRLDAIMQMYMGGLGLICLVEFIDFSPAHPGFADQYYQVGVILLLVAGVRSVRRGFYPARFYLIALLLFLLGIVTFLSLAAGLLPLNTFTLNALLIGQTGEMLMMSVALSTKLKIYEREATKSSLKTQLLKVITHDLNNSLSIIKMSAEHAQALGAERSKEQILKATAFIQGVVQEAHERRLTHTSAIKLTAVSVEDIFEDLRFAYDSRAAEKGLVLRFDISDPELRVMANRVALCQHILGNILSNAIKFSPLGSEIVISAKPRNRHSLQISVRDRGKGIPKRKISEMLREDTDVVSELGTSGEKGLGIGLSIVKNYLKDCNGSLEIKSVVNSEPGLGSGTTVTVLLKRGDKLNEALKMFQIRSTASGITDVTST